MAALTRGLRVLIPLVLDNKLESDGGTLTPSLCRHATTFATRRPRKDSGFLARDFVVCGFLAGSFSVRCLFAAFLLGRPVFAIAPKLHLLSAVLRLASVTFFDTCHSPLLRTVTPFLRTHVANSESAYAVSAERCGLVVYLEAPPHPHSTTSIHPHIVTPATSWPTNCKRLAD